MVLGLLVNLGRTSNDTSVTGAFFFLIVFLGCTINAACDRNSCKLFGKKKVVDVFPKKSLRFFSLRYRFL